MPRPKNKREVRLSINVTPEVDIRIRNAADVAGVPEAVLASLSLAMGLRMLEQGLLGVSADTITQAASALSVRAEQEFIEAASVPQVPEQKREEKRPFKMELEQSTTQWTGYMSGL